MFAAIFVQRGQNGGGRHVHAVDRHGIALFKADLDVFRRVGCIFRADGALIDVFGRVFGGVFQNLALGRGVQKVRINRERRFATFVFRNGDLVLFGKFQQFGARAQLPFTPGRDHHDFRVQRIGRQFEPNLVIALAGRAVGHGVGAMFSSQFNQTLGNQRTRN